MAVGAQIAAGKVALMVVGCALVPAPGCVVVVRTGVDDKVALVVVRQELVAGVGAKGKLQDLHARQPKAVAQLDHVRRDLAQVFGNNGQVFAQLLAHDVEEVCARSLLPLCL